MIDDTCGLGISIENLGMPVKEPLVGRSCTVSYPEAPVVVLNSGACSSSLANEINCPRPPEKTHDDKLPRRHDGAGRQPAACFRRC